MVIGHWGGSDGYAVVSPEVQMPAASPPGSTVPDGGKPL